MISIVRVDQTTALGWQLMPFALQRIAAFCDGRYPTELSAEELVSATKSWFGGGSPDMGLWVALDGPRIVGHMLAAYEPRRKLAFIYQLEFDPKPLPLSVYRAGLAALEGWARALGARALEATTWHDRFPGFRAHRQVVRRTLEEPTDG